MRGGPEKPFPNNDQPLTIGDRMRALMNHWGYQFDELIKPVDYSAKRLRAVVSGRETPNPVLFARFAWFFGQDPIDLLSIPRDQIQNLWESREDKTLKPPPLVDSFFPSREETNRILEAIREYGSNSTPAQIVQTT